MIRPPHKVYGMPQGTREFDSVFLPCRLTTLKHAARLFLNAALMMLQAQRVSLTMAVGYCSTPMMKSNTLGAAFLLSNPRPIKQMRLYPSSGLFDSKNRICGNSKTRDQSNSDHFPFIRIIRFFSFRVPPRVSANI